MKVLEQFSEQEESYYTYISRQQIRMKERSMEAELEEAKAEAVQAKVDAKAKIEQAKTDAKAKIEQAKAEVEQAKAEAEQVRADSEANAEQVKVEKELLIKRIAELEAKVK